jgi:single-strand DNA-binding protein
MAGELVITVVGRLTGDPELKFTASGLAVVNFTIVQSDRIFDKATNSWKDGAPLYLRASCWREHAEHIAGSLTKGTHVIAQGRLKQREYTNNAGEKRSSMEFEVDEIGPCLRFATASVTRAQSAAQRGAPVEQQADLEPWAASTPAASAPVAAGQGADVWNTPGNFDDSETPF